MEVVADAAVVAVAVADAVVTVVAAVAAHAVDGRCSSVVG